VLLHVFFLCVLDCVGPQLMTRESTSSMSEAVTNESEEQVGMNSFT